MNDVNHAEVAATLHKAADLIEERGWVQGSGWHDLANYDGPLCAQGVFAVLDGKSSAVGYRCPAMNSLMDYLGIRMGLFAWNDKPNRTAEDVIAALRAAAAIEQAKHDATLPTADVLSTFAGPGGTELTFYADGSAVVTAPVSHPHEGRFVVDALVEVTG